MARKLLILVALISLVMLTQASPGYAATYTLPTGIYNCTETFPVDGTFYTPGSEGSTLSGWYRWGEGGLWLIGGEAAFTPDGDIYQINSPVKVTDRTGGPGDTSSPGSLSTFVYTYDDSVLQNEWRFTVNIPGGPSIISDDLELTITASYRYTDDVNQLWIFQSDIIATIEGGGTDYFSQQPFTVSGIMVEDTGDHTHWVHFENFVLTYPASTVPIPGAVWLLGTGLLGLLCLGRRRKR